VVAAFRDARLSANRASGYTQKMPPAAREALAPLLSHLASALALLDPPAHTRLRALVNKAFVPRLVDRMRLRIETIVEGLFDSLMASPEADLIHDFAALLPIFVIADILGLPREDQALLRRCSDTMIAFIGARRMNMEIAGAAAAAVRELEDYFRERIAERRA